MPIKAASARRASAPKHGVSSPVIQTHFGFNPSVSLKTKVNAEKPIPSPFASSPSSGILYNTLFAQSLPLCMWGILSRPNRGNCICCLKQQPMGLCTFWNLLYFIVFYLVLLLHVIKQADCRLAYIWRCDLILISPSSIPQCLLMISLVETYILLCINYMHALESSHSLIQAAGPRATTTRKNVVFSLCTPFSPSWLNSCCLYCELQPKISATYAGDGPHQPSTPAALYALPSLGSESNSSIHSSVLMSGSPQLPFACTPSKLSCTDQGVWPHVLHNFWHLLLLALSLLYCWWWDCQLSSQVFQTRLSFWRPWRLLQCLQCARLARKL